MNGLLRDVRVEMTTPTGERCVALLGDVEREAMANALESLRAGSEAAERKALSAQVERDFRAHQTALSERAEARRVRSERREADRIRGIREAAARLGRRV